MNRAVSGRTAALLIAGGLCAMAQGTQTASVTGSVIDTDSAPIVGALVRLTSSSLQGIRIVTTDAKGRFLARLLPPGDYLIEITKDGYQTIHLKQRLGLDQNFQPRFRMAGNAVVVVTAAPPAVDKTDAKTASNYRMDQVNLLPVDRSMESLALLTPGVVAGVDGGVQVRGAMTSNNLMLVDGQNVEDSAYGNRGVSLIEDAVEEVQVLTGALSAEYGNVDGGVVNAITRSGSNTLTGQVRWNFRNPSWNAVGPLVDRGGIDDHTGMDTTFSLGGYLVKDRLWFHAAYFKEDLREARSISSDAFSDPAWPGGAGSTYTYGRDETRRQLKLTWLVHPDHTLVASYMGSGTRHQNRDYLSGSQDTLVPQHDDDELLNVAWRAIWSPQVISDIRYGIKKQTLRAGTTGNPASIAISPIYDDGTGLYYNHGLFNGDDGGDHRDNRTFNAKTSVFLEGLGSHQLDAGIDWYQGIRRARAERSSTGYVFEVSEIDPVHQTAVPQSVWIYGSGSGEATVENKGLYLNDKWVLNDHLAFQLGLRWDRYLGQDESGNKLAGSAAWSPRLGLKYDLLGDSKWIAGASYARYNGKILDQILTSVTHQGNVQEVDYLALDNTTPRTWSEIFDLANYDYSAAGVFYANLPGVNTRMNPDLKAPSIDEYQVSFAYAFQDTPIGQGYVRATGVHKNWKNLIDYRIGNDGRGSYVIPGSGEMAEPYVYYWYNNPDARRTYQALELEFSTAKYRWQVQGSFTWSRLRGNYEGQDEWTPGRGEGIHAWDVTDGRVMFDRNITAPEGYLRGHVPFRARILGTYRVNSPLGETTFGALYRFDAGSHESETRNITGEALNPDLPDEARNTWFTQYKDGRRGGYVGRSSWYLDVSVNHEWGLFTVKAVPVRAFFKAVIKNVFNHQQLLRTPQTYEAATTSASEPWVPAANHGVPGPDCYGEARSYAFALGVRF